jgi:hypothetical protein
MSSRIATPPPSQRVDHQDVKKQRELFYLREFNQLSKSGITEIVPGTDRDGQPDFLGTLNGSKIGIELAQMFVDSDQEAKGSLSKQNEEEIQRKLRHVADLTYAAGSLPVKARFETELPQDLKGCATEIAKRSCTIPIWGEDDFLYQDCPISILKLPEAPETEKYSLWEHVPTNVAWQRGVTPDFFELAIQDKVAKLPGYLRHADRILLLLYAVRSRKSGFLDLAAKGLKIDRRGFESVFLYLHPGTWKEL